MLQSGSIVVSFFHYDETAKERYRTNTVVTALDYMYVFQINFSDECVFIDSIPPLEHTLQFGRNK